MNSAGRKVVQVLFASTPGLLGPQLLALVGFPRSSPNTGAAQWVRRRGQTQGYDFPQRNKKEAGFFYRMRSAGSGERERLRGVEGGEVKIRM